MNIEKISLKNKLALITKHWEPKIIGELNNQHIKIAKVKGEFIMHHHQNEDELFMVIEGQLFIEFTDKTVTLNPGEMLIIPRGIEHKPFSEVETHILLFEPSGTLNTGNIDNDLTVETIERL